MPKNKTHSGTAKRVKITGTGKLRRQQTRLRHRLEVKPSTVTRRQSGTVEIAPADVKRARELAEAGRAAAGRPTGPHIITVYLTAATGPDSDARLDADRRYWKLDEDAAHGVGGDAAAIATAVAAYAEAGADTVVVQPTIDEPDPAGFVRFVGEQVRPLVD